jgi:hypothetical protein
LAPSSLSSLFSFESQSEIANTGNLKRGRLSASLFEQRDMSPRQAPAVIGLGIKV